MKLRQCDFKLCNACNEKRVEERRIFWQRNNQTDIVTVQQAAMTAHDSELVIVKTLNKEELEAISTNQILANIRSKMVSILPEDVDQVQVANNALIQHNRIKEFVATRLQELSAPQVVFSDETILAAATSNEEHDQPPSVTAARIDCVNSCELQHVERGKSLECGLCQSLFHRTCVGLKPNSRPALWICPHCKEIPSTVKALMSKQESQERLINQLRNENSTLLRLLNEQRATMETTRPASSVGSQSDLPAPGSEASRNPPATLEQHDSPNIAPDTPQSTPAENSAHAKPTLIIGDSMIRDISERGLDNTRVKCIRGGRVANIREELSNLGPDQFGSVLLHVGTNDCSSDAKLKEGIRHYREMIGEIQSNAPSTKVLVSTICPRKDNINNNNRVQNFNVELRNIAREKKCSLVDNDGCFFLQNKDIDSASFNGQGLHLSKAGTRKLIMNFNGIHKIISSRRPAPASPTRSRRDNSPQDRDRRPSERARRQHRQQMHRDMHRDGCSFCGLLNHSTRECFHRKPVQCHNCHEYGHKSYICRAEHFDSRWERASVRRGRWDHGVSWD